MKDYQVELISESRSILQLRVRATSKGDAQTVAMKRVKELGLAGYTVTKVAEI
jgi:hypothetical protein